MSILGPRAIGTILMLGGPMGAAMDTIRQSAYAPDMQACHPQGWGPEETPLPSPPPFPSHRHHPTPVGQAATSPRVSTAAPTCTPSRDHQSLASGMGPCASCLGWLLPEEPAHPHVFTQARGTSLTQTQTNRKSQFRSPSEMAQGSDHGRPCWEIFSGCYQVPRALLVLSTLPLLVYLLQPPTSASQVPPAFRKTQSVQVRALP